jgi:hypothetical protein
MQGSYVLEKKTSFSHLEDKPADRTMIRCAFFAKKTGANSKIKTKGTHKQKEELKGGISSCP